MGQNGLQRGLYSHAQHEPDRAKLGAESWKMVILQLRMAPIMVRDPTGTARESKRLGQPIDQHLLPTL